MKQFTHHPTACYELPLKFKTTNDEKLIQIASKSSYQIHYSCFFSTTHRKLIEKLIETNRQQQDYNLNTLLVNNRDSIFIILTLCYPHLLEAG